MTQDTEEPGDPQQIPPSDLESLIHACLEAEDPEAELARRTERQPQMRAMAQRVLARVREREANPTATMLGHPPAMEVPEAVQPTSTDELLHRLADAPRLDRARYCAEGELGRGGMGVVLRIRDTHLNRRLAMKTLLERKERRDSESGDLRRQVLARFLEEAQVTSQLDHPGVIPVHELGLDHNGEVYFTMRLVKGLTASVVFALARTEQEGWTRTRAIDVVLKVCDAMAYAHSKGVLHRDVKPANIMIGRFGEVYVMDWGLAKLIGQPDAHDLRIRPDPAKSMSGVFSVRQRDAHSDEDSSLATMDGQHLGTPSYMAPEQARSEPLDARADVYAIGAMLYELLAGRAPYTTPGLRRSAYDALRAVVEGPPQRIEHLDKTAPPELVAIADKAMQRDLAARYASVTELAADLRAFIEQRVVRAYQTGAIVELRMWVRRNRPLAAALGAAVVILVAGIASTMSFALEARENAAAMEQRARDLTQVVAFQESQWAQIDIERTGIYLRRTVLDAVAESRRPTLEAELAPVNFTTVARSLLLDDLFGRDLELVDRQLGNQPVVKASLLQTIAGSLGKLGLFEQAMAPQREALDIRRRMLGDQHRDTMESLNRTAALLLDLERPDDAEPFIREALAKCPHLLGDDDPETVAAIVAMGRLHKARRELTQAEPFLRDAVQKRRRTLGDLDPQTLAAINSLGGLLRDMDRHDEAEQYVRESLDKRRRVLGDDHPETLNSIRSMAVLLRMQGKLEEAERLWREACERSRRILGDQHRETVRSITSLGLVLVQQNRHGAAIELLKDTEPAARKRSDDVRLAVLLLALGQAYAGPGPSREFAVAESKLIEAHALFSKLRARDPQNFRRATQALIRLYEDWHTYDPSEVSAQRVVDWKAKLPAPAAREQESR